MRNKSLKWFIAIAMFFSFFSCSKLEKDEEAIMQIMGEMSLKEKVCQMFIIRPESLVCPDDPQSFEVTRLGVDIVLLPADYVKAVDGIIKAVAEKVLIRV